MFRIKQRYLFIFLLGAYSFLNIKFTEGDSLVTLPLGDVAFYLVIQLLVLMIWEGNRLFERAITKKPSKKIAHRLIQQFGVSLALITGLSALATFAINTALSIDVTIIAIKLLFLFNFRINLFLHCVNAIVVYNNELSQTKLEAEQLKKETSEAQFEALRRQLNPHFLFNSFNVLSSLIETDPKMAEQFVAQLSKVYRYLLKTQDLKVVSLEEELDFLASYIFLLKIRFQSNLEIDLELKDYDKKFLPPSTLQLLIENAIKHNEVSKQYPLKIKLYQKNGSLVVNNNLNPKAVPEESSLVGLNNIKSRYLLLGGEAPLVNKTDEAFVVTIPLIEG